MTSYAQTADMVREIYEAQGGPTTNATMRWLMTWTRQEEGERLDRLAAHWAACPDADRAALAIFLAERDAAHLERADARVPAFILDDYIELVAAWTRRQLF